MSNTRHIAAYIQAAPPAGTINVDETEDLAALGLLRPKDAGLPNPVAVYVLPMFWDQQEQAAGLIPPTLGVDEDYPPASLGLLVPKDIGLPPRWAIALPGLHESNDQQSPLFISVGFPYDTLTGAAPVIDLVYDTLGNTVALVKFLYDVNPGPSVTTRFPYDVVQPTPTWTSPIKRRSTPS